MFIVRLWYHDDPIFRWLHIFLTCNVIVFTSQPGTLVGTHRLGMWALVVIICHCFEHVIVNSSGDMIVLPEYHRKIVKIVFVRYLIVISRAEDAPGCISQACYSMTRTGNTKSAYAKLNLVLRSQYFQNPVNLPSTAYCEFASLCCNPYSSAYCNGISLLSVNDNITYTRYRVTHTINTIWYY